MGVCPHCKANITDVTIASVTLEASNLSTFRGLSYSCPHCQSVLNVGIDPGTQIAALTASVMEALRTD